MRRNNFTCSGLVLGLSALLGSTVSAVNAGPEPIELEETFVIIEINATDGDAGIHFFLDGDAWQNMTITGPDDKLVANINVSGSLAVQGLTEIFSESSEPSFKEQPLEEFLKLFPPGTYEYAGTTIEGDPIIGSAELTHALPDAPVLISPLAGGPVNLNNVVIAWEPVPNPTDSKIIAYQLVVELSEKPLREFVLDLPATVTSVSVPAGILEPDTEYKFEIVAREESGNQTITETTFTTGPEGPDTCGGDINGDANVNVTDLLLLLSVWGGCG